MKIFLITLLILFSYNAKSFYYLDVISGNSQNLLPPNNSFLTTSILGDTLEGDITADTIANNRIALRIGRTFKPGYSLEIGYKNLGNTGFESEDIFSFDQNVKALSFGYRRYFDYIYIRLGLDILNIQQSVKNRNTDPNISLDLDYKQGEYYTIGSYFSFGFAFPLNNKFSILTDFGARAWAHKDGKVAIDQFDSNSGQFERDGTFDPKILHIIGEFHFGIQYRLF